MLILPPISFKVSIRPFLPWLIMILFKFILLLGVIIAATIGNAADDGSLGIEIFFPFNKGLPSNSIIFDMFLYAFLVST